MSRWFSSVGFEGRTSRILAFKSFTEVVAGRWWKLRGLSTPIEGDKTTRVNVVGSGRSSCSVGASPSDGTGKLEGASDMVRGG